MIFVNPYAGVNQDIPNLGLAYAATYFKTPVIDLNTKPSAHNRYLRQCEEVVGISVQSRTFHQAELIRKNYLRKYPRSQVKSVTCSVDIQCCYPYVKFSENIEMGEPFCDAYPFPAYELFDSFPVFLSHWQQGRWAYAIMTSVGCPYQCVYCMSRNRKWLARSAQNCYSELKEAKRKWGIKKCLIIDDCFNISRERVAEFCDLTKELALEWSCANGLRADLFDEAQAKAMSSCGCRQVSLGIESIDEEVLQAIHKGETAGQIERAVDIATRYFQRVNGFFILGLPGSTYEKDLKNLQWAKSKGINAHFSYYVPFDKQMQLDRVFYGEKAEPLSDAYPKQLQKKLYIMTKDMRPGKRIDFLSRLFS